MERLLVIGCDSKLSFTVFHVINEKIIPFDFITKGTTKLDLYVAGNLVSSDSVDMSFDDSGNVDIYLRADTVEIKAGTHPAMLKVYYSTRPNGRALMHPEFPDSNLDIKAVHQLGT